MKSLSEKVILDFGSFSKHILGSLGMMLIVKTYMEYFKRESLDCPPLVNPYTMVLMIEFAP